MNFQARFSAICALTIMCALVSAQMDPAPKITLKISPSKVVAGKSFQAVLTVTFSEGLHAYQNPPTDPTLIPVTVEEKDKAFKIVKVGYPKGTPTKVGGESTPVNVYQGTIQIPVTLLAPPKLGKSTLNLSFGYQQCNESSCFPPGKVAISVPITTIKGTTSGKFKAKS